MPICKLCGRERKKLVLHNPFYGVMANKGTRKIKICHACSLILQDHSTKRFTNVLQSEIWDHAPTDPMDALMRPMRRINYMVRYAGEVTANPESLSEHSYSVLLFAVQIAKLSNLTVDFERLVSIAMFHDVAEIMLGDIPTPLKTGELKKENLELEKQAINTLNNKWKIWTGGVNTYNHDDLTDIESRIVKLADLLSAVIYSAEEVYIGSHNLEDALKRTVQKMAKYVHHDWEKKVFKNALDHIDKTLGWGMEKFIV
jgi:5'-deoxynucleotidase